MAFLTIAGTTIRCQRDTATRRTIRVGTSSRAFAGNLRSAIRAEKIEGTVTTALYAASDAATIEALFASGAQVAITGDWLGSITAEVESGDSPAIAVGTGFKRRLSLTIRQV